MTAADVKAARDTSSEGAPPDEPCTAASGSSPPALLDPDIALQTVLDHVPRAESQRRALGEAWGLILAEDIVAEADQPPFTRALMDGFAVRLSDAGRQPFVAGVVAAGQAAEQALSEGSVVEIMTGAPCPAGSEAVVRVEDTSRRNGHVQLPDHIVAGQNIQPSGTLCRRGQLVLGRGQRLTPLALAAAAASGRRALRVAAPPSIAIITTGDEVQSGETLPTGAAIADSNGPMLVAMARQAGCERVAHSHARDDESSLAESIETAVAADLLVLSGGVSMGRRDLVPAILEKLGARIEFHKVRQQPGKPLLFATRGRQLIFGLPGTPLGSHLGFHRYVARAIRRWLGVTTEPELLRGTLSAPLQARSDRNLFRLVRARRGLEGWLIEPLRWLGSSDIIGPALANGYCRFAPGTHELAAGTELDWEPIGAMASGPCDEPAEAQGDWARHT